VGNGRGEALAQAARDHARSVVTPQIARWDAERRFPRDAVLAAGESGLCGLFAPAEAGGQAVSFEDGMGVFEELGRADASYAFAVSMQNAVANTIGRAESEPLRAAWAARLAAGSALGGFSLTEPHAGSDAAAITTRAERTADGYRLSGRKAWASLAGEADLYVLACRTGSRTGNGGMMLVALPADRAGVSVAKLYDKMASAFLPIGELGLDGVEVADDEVLAPPGQGFQAALAAIDVARADIAAIAVGLAAEALDLALGYARERQIFGGRLLDLQAIQFALADVETDVVAGRLLYRRAAQRLGTPEGSVLAAHAKRFCPDAALRAAIACSEVLGAYGWLHETPLPRFIALAKMLQVVDGTTEIQRVVIARDLARRAEALEAPIRPWGS
jgi:alkylation response protein AidB-like acyl-CoA dehydrogenase